MQQLSWSDPVVITFTIYLAAMLFIGWLGHLGTRNLSDYILGGRRLGSFVTALSAGASDMSGWLLLGLPGAVYVSGLSEAWIAIGLCIGAYLNWRLVAARLRLYTERVGNALTLPDYLTYRFEDSSHALRIVAASVILVFFTVYCASGVVAGARLFENMFAMPYAVALWAGAACTITYVLIGGFLAVSWTDTVQASLMIIALLLTPIMAWWVIQDELNASADFAALFAAEQASLIHGTSLVGIISLLAWGLGYFGQPHILVRFMAASSVAAIPNARRIGMTWMILCLMGAVAIGFIGIPYFALHVDSAAAVNANAETVFMELAGYLFNPWITGVLLAAILAAVMSTLSCQLLICSSALTQDIYHTFLRKTASQRELVWTGRAMVLIVALIAIGLAGDPESKVLGMVSYAWAGFGAAFGPVIILSLFWGRMTRNGALAGIITGAITVLLWKQYGWSDLYEIIPGFMLSTLAVILISYMDSALADSILVSHVAVQQELAQAKEL